MNSRHIVSLLQIIVLIKGFLTYDILNLTGWLLLLLTYLNIIILNKCSFMQNCSKYLVLFSIWISVIFIPIFQLSDKNLLDIEYLKVLEFGIVVNLIIDIVWLFCIILKPRNNRCNYIYIPKQIPTKYINLFFLIIIFLSIFCYSIGLGKMGSDAVVLPFHLGGIINLFRKVLVPKRYFVYFIFWSIIEMFSWLSKSIVIENFLPTLFVLYLYYRPSLKKTLLTLSMFALFFFSMYPIVANMRYDDSNGLSNKLKNAKQINDEVDSNNSLYIPLNRAFMTCNMYVKDYYYFDQENLFDFTRIPLLFALGGAEEYQTHVIDGFSIYANHSSGTTGLIDPLLHGGYGVCFIVIIILFLIANIVDYHLYKNEYSILAILLLIIYNYCNVNNISSFYNSVGVPILFVKLLAIYIAYYINFQRRYKICNV